MKIAAIEGRCTGHARCAAVSSTIFELDDDGYIAIVEKEIAVEDEQLARRGVRACPERALVIIEDGDSSDEKA